MYEAGTLPKLEPAEDPAPAFSSSSEDLQRWERLFELLLHSPGMSQQEFGAALFSAFKEDPSMSLDEFARRHWIDDDLKQMIREMIFQRRTASHRNRIIFIEHWCIEH